MLIATIILAVIVFLLLGGAWLYREQLREGIEKRRLEDLSKQPIPASLLSLLSEKGKGN